MLGPVSIVRATAIAPPVPQLNTEDLDGARRVGGDAKICHGRD